MRGEWIPAGDGTVTFRSLCVACRRPSEVTGLDPAKVALFDNGRGPFIQDVWPELSAGDREIIVSGTHDACFDVMFPPDELDGDEDWAELDSLYATEPDDEGE